MDASARLGAESEEGASTPSSVAQSKGRSLTRAILDRQVVPAERPDMVYLLFLFVHLLGFASSINALMGTRTPQGTIAWLVSLNTMPWVAVPAYWVFGRNKFKGYVIRRKEVAESHDPVVARLVEELSPHRAFGEGDQVGEKLADLPYLSGNAVELLVDGEATFASIFSGISRAQETVLVQFYIIHDDELGRELQRRLIERAQAGVRVWLLFDEIGSHALPARYLRSLRDAGVLVSAFHTTRGVGNRFQLNFRNHRKIVVVDTENGWVGGHNVGDEYMGRVPKFGHWRDTHVRITGPAVLGLVASFAEDWAWATGEALPEFVWRASGSSVGDARVLIIPSGPADRLETASLMYQQAIQSARQRIWIASPYFIPDQAVLHALHLAALRGVDVRLIIPDNPDHILVYYSAFNFIEPLLASGVRVYRYQDGFMHQKVFLVDHGVAGIGTANFDNRSFRLNFEVTAVVHDAPLAAEVEDMLTRDFGRSEEMKLPLLDARGARFRIAVRLASLLAPVQ